MEDLNCVNLIGRLVKDVEIKYSQTGTCIARFTVAVNGHGVKQNDGSYKSDSSFFDVTWFSKLAESLKQYLVKGQQIGLTGSLKQEHWEKDGQKFSKVGIIADGVYLLGGQKQQTQQKQAPVTQQVSDAGYAPTAQVGDVSFNQDIPF